MKHYCYSKLLFCLCLILITTFFINTVYAESALISDETNATVDIDRIDSSESESKSNIIYDFIVPLSIEFIGAFLGFFFAIQLENRTKHQQIKNVHAELLIELEAIADDIKKSYNLAQDKDGNLKVGSVDLVFLYQTPKWDILLAAGELAAIVNEAKKSNVDFLDIYSDIFHAQNLEQEYLTVKKTQNLNDTFLNEYIEKIKAEKLNIAIQICNKINLLCRRD